MDEGNTVRNNAALERLKALIAQLGDEDLSRRLDNGWTVSVTLAHLAYWDKHALATLDEWQQSGAMPVTGNYNAINDDLLAQWETIPRRDAANQAVAVATALDQRIMQLDPTFVDSVLAAGRHRLLDRSIHRQAHIDEIERAIASPA